uniref:Alpha-1,2-Mannosidase n=1 Tax=Heterorhabditis bacteriophora TaxID=37862 RepID=A0A1I7XH52_HETBA
MDSFVLSETFKYLYMIFAEPSDLLFDPDNYVLTTEAHFLPLSIGTHKDETIQGEVVTCEIDGNGAPTTVHSIAVGLSSQNLALSQMISLLMLVLVLWLLLMFTAAAIICVSAIISRAVNKAAKNE